MSRYRQANLDQIRSQAVGERHSKVTIDRFARPVTPEMGGLVDVLPSLLAGDDLRAIADAVVTAARASRPVLVMAGGHVVKTGTSPVLIQLLRENVITALALNGATAIHDYEIARFGRTSEDVAAALGSGTFGMAGETSREMNAVTADARERGEGLGEALGRSLIETGAPHAEVSLLAEAYRLGRPATVHVAVGTDILHQHATADGAAIGETTHRDFRILAGVLEGFRGGVALNLGSAVILPEVFLKAFSIATNLGAELTDIVTADFDFIRHYRPGANVVRRPTADGRGRGYQLTGHHEILVPLLAAAVLSRLKRSV